MDFIRVSMVITATVDATEHPLHSTDGVNGNIGGDCTRECSNCISPEDTDLNTQSLYVRTNDITHIRKCDNWDTLCSLSGYKRDPPDMAEFLYFHDPAPCEEERPGSSMD